jgi:hypothetical protein
MPSLRLKELLPRLANVRDLGVYGERRTQANVPFRDIFVNWQCFLNVGRRSKIGNYAVISMPAGS